MPCEIEVPMQLPSDIPFIVEDDDHLLGDIVNLSTTSLSHEQLSALSHITKFREHCKKVPYMQLIVGVESACRQLEDFGFGSAVQFRSLCADLIRKVPKPPPNVSVQLGRVLRKIGQNEQLIITASDKGGKLIVLDSVQYGAMCLKHLEDSAYQRVYTVGTGKNQIIIDDGQNELFSPDFSKPDVSDHLLWIQCRDLTDLLGQLKRTNDLHECERRALVLGQPYTGVLPQFYGLPKLHKLGELKLRPIISNSGLYSDKVMLKLKSVLNLLLWGSTSMGNSYQFAELLRHYQFEPDDVMASFDISSLFTKVPVQETLLIVEKRLADVRKLEPDPIKEVMSLTNTGILKLLNHILCQCTFSWDGLLYTQSAGLPMGGRLLPVLANLFMEEFEYKVLTTVWPIPKIWFRYVDDVFIVWNLMNGSYSEFLAILNRQNPNIVFMLESENDGVLPFFYLLVKRPQFDRKGAMKELLQLSVYHKLTHCDRFIHYNSSHHMSLKRNQVFGLYLRVARLLQFYPVQLEAELKHLKVAFCSQKNQYPGHVVDHWFREFNTQLLNNPEKLTVKSRIEPEMVFADKKQQIFEFPLAKS